MIQDAIFASKLFKSSNRQDKIKAALDNPLNVELVKQLSSYLDDKSQNILKQNHSDAEESSSENKKSSSDEESIRPNVSSSPHSADRSAPSSHSDHHLSDMMDDNQDDMQITPPSDSEGSEESVSESDVESSTCIVCNIADELDSIKGLLNSRQDTCGVIRAVIKDDELWLHYNDNTNLNNVMENVIALMNSAGYGNLQFNRLARTENAVVFYITCYTREMESITGVEND